MISEMTQGNHSSPFINVITAKQLSLFKETLQYLAIGHKAHYYHRNVASEHQGRQPLLVPKSLTSGGKAMKSLGLQGLFDNICS